MTFVERMLKLADLMDEAVDLMSSQQTDEESLDKLREIVAKAYCLGRGEI